MLAARWSRASWRGLRPGLRCASSGPRPSKGPRAAPQRVLLNYQDEPPPGKRNGRYIDQPDRGDVCDASRLYEVDMHDARRLEEPATLETFGFALESAPTVVSDFRDVAAVESVYYGEVRKLVKKASGASKVLVFDHTIRESGSTSLNASKTGTAAPVPRVHCDYTHDGAPKRLALLGEAGINSLVKGRTMTPAEVDALAAGRYAFVNVWRSIDAERPVGRMPLAVLDERSIQPGESFIYELLFPDRRGENYSLKFSPNHKWFTYPAMTKDEALVFKVHDTNETGTRFVFHTAFDDPWTVPEAPKRISIEVRTVAFFDATETGDATVASSTNGASTSAAACSLGRDDAATAQFSVTKSKPVFFDMTHSNNAARIRLWLAMKSSTVSEMVERRVVDYNDLQTAAFAAVNPLKKVPALIRDDGGTVFEAAVILSYLEDKYCDAGPRFRPPTPEARQLVDLMVRLHDLYVASPNCTAPGFSHSQGAMYLSEEWHGVKRRVTLEERSAKLAEVWKQLLWLDTTLEGNPYLVGGEASVADLTWFPTAVFCDFLLPRVFGWPDLLSTTNASAASLPRLAKWYACMQSRHEPMRAVRADIWAHWVKMEAAGQFEAIQHHIAQLPQLKCPLLNAAAFP
ncbi:hypothetical protein M885DRAFT_463553 [Pelagophyceae sp. CCMP2097]|nr:hypothetical protein M885DRAFT_463553 [Pelagophyceae sp. CCMP2097]|mmetsp:Transcript_18804/g.63526  ORF Transcript_18804/g.63526 Transcript_18804/m.63526 type:complete len:630 (+) Transcript_18804:116-2005(+)